MNNVIMRKIILTADYAPLSAISLVGTVTISAPWSNIAAVYFKGDGGSDVPWQRGEYHTFKRIDLAGIQVKGTPGDVLTINGGTW